MSTHTWNNLNRWRQQLDAARVLADAQFEERSVDAKKLVEMSLHGREPDGAEENAVGAAPSQGHLREAWGREANVDPPEGWEQGTQRGQCLVGRSERW